MDPDGSEHEAPLASYLTIAAGAHKAHEWGPLSFELK